MLNYLTIIFCCQLAGELTVSSLGLPLPGPVLGMVLLFAGLLINKGIPEDLALAADGLLSNMSLLFVPAGAGVMLHAKLMRQEWLPISVAVILSTLVTIAVTALMMTWLGGKPRRGEPGREGDTKQG